MIILKEMPDIMSEPDLQKCIDIDHVNIQIDKTRQAQNAEAYRLCINSWLYIIQDIAGIETMKSFYDIIVTNGLRATIIQCKSSADRLLLNGRSDVWFIDHMLSLLVLDAYNFNPNTCDNSMTFGSEMIAGQEYISALGKVLMILRYPKRLTVNNDDLQDESLQKFIDVQSEVYDEVQTSDPLPRKVQKLSYHKRRFRYDDLISEEFARLCQVKTKPKHPQPDDWRYVTTPGSVQERREVFASSSPLAKWIDYKHKRGEAIQLTVSRFVIPYEIATHKKTASEILDSFANDKVVTDYVERVVVPSPVPKSIDAYRIIAPESAEVCASGTVARERLLESLSTSKAFKAAIHLDYQEANQDMAREGSLLEPNICQMATVDESHASDSVSKYLIETYAPAWFSDYCRRYWPSYYIDKKSMRIKRLNAAFTSGNPLTFVVESIFFCAVARAAVRLWCMWNGHTRAQTEQFVALVRVYGDDIALPSMCVEVLFQLFDRLNIVYNPTKTHYQDYEHRVKVQVLPWASADVTFSPIRYRESCGAEYVNGYEISSCYFPRKAMWWTVDVEREGAQGIETTWYSRMVSLMSKLSAFSPAATGYIYSQLCKKLPNKKFLINPKFFIGKLPLRLSDRTNFKDLGNVCLSDTVEVRRLNLTPVTYLHHECVHPGRFCIMSTIKYPCGYEHVSHVLREETRISGPYTTTYTEETTDYRFFERGTTRMPVMEYYSLNLDEQNRSRIKVSVPSVRYRMPKLGKEQLLALRAAYEQYKYEYLTSYGPRYANELDRLLGVSSPFPTLEHLVGVPEATVSWQFE